MASLSKHVLEAMGFQVRLPDSTLAAVFHSLRVYEVQGIVLDYQSIEPISGSVQGVAYTLSIGSSVNAICRTIMSEDYTDSEQDWQKEHRCSPPYLIVHLGPTTKHDAPPAITLKTMARPLQHTTAFFHARAELQKIEDKVLPSLVSALSCAFSSNDQHVRFAPVDHAIVGITDDCRTVLDFRIEISAAAYVSSKLDRTQIKSKLFAAIKTADSMDPKVARFFQLALEETDPLKKFLYFFLAIEIETHAAFAKIDHSTRLSMLIGVPDRVAESTLEFFDGQRKRWTSLGDRFVWCVLCIWPHLNDADVVEFKRIKKVRNEITHGSIAAPPHWAVAGAEKIATKLQLST